VTVGRPRPKLRIREQSLAVEWGAMRGSIAEGEVRWSWYKVVHDTMPTNWGLHTIKQQSTVVFAAVRETPLHSLTACTDTGAIQTEPETWVSCPSFHFCHDPSVRFCYGSQVTWYNTLSPEDDPSTCWTAWTLWGDRSGMQDRGRIVITWVFVTTADPAGSKFAATLKPEPTQRNSLDRLQIRK
jgi:hypothetical protein